MSMADTVPAFGGGWAHTHGLFELKVPAPLGDLTALSDRHAITDAVACYAWSVDEQQYDLMADLFTQDMTFQGCVAGVANLETVVGGATLVAWLKDFLGSRDDQFRHTLANVVVTEQGPDTATALAYCVLASSTPAGSVVQATGIYRFSLVKGGERWRISGMYGGFDAVPF